MKASMAAAACRRRNVAVASEMTAAWRMWRHLGGEIMVSSKNGISMAAMNGGASEKHRRRQAWRQSMAGGEENEE